MAKAIEATLVSPNESDSNGEAANVVDGLFTIAQAIHDLADAVRQAKGGVTNKERVLPGNDSTATPQGTVEATE